MRVQSLGPEDSPGEESGNPLQYSCLRNPMDRGAWWTTVHGVAKSWTRLSGFIFTFFTCLHPVFSSTEGALELRPVHKLSAGLRRGSGPRLRLLCLVGIL